jgi:hypothetical protein
MNTNYKRFFSKKACRAILVALGIESSVFAATLHIENKLNDIIWVNAVGSNGSMYSNTIQPHTSVKINTWFASINDIYWEIDNTRWAARPALEVGSLQTEGRLSIGKEGAYSFKPCALCSQVTGQAQKVPRN